MAHETTFGATIVPTSDKHHHVDQQPQLHVRPFNDSPALTPTVSRDASAADFYLDQSPAIQSPFYLHPPASHEVVAPHGRRHGGNGKLDVATLEKDLESGNATPLSASDDENPFTKRHCVQENTEDTMWPSRLALKEKKKAQKQQTRDKRGVRGCAPLRNRWSQLSKRNRILVQVAIALLIVGIAVAIGVGISVAVKGTYYVADGNSKTIGQ